MGSTLAWISALLLTVVGPSGCADETPLRCHEISSDSDCNRQVGCRYLGHTGTTVFGEVSTCFTDCSSRRPCEDGLVCNLVQIADGTGFSFGDVCIDPP